MAGASGWLPVIGSVLLGSLAMVALGGLMSMLRRTFLAGHAAQLIGALGIAVTGFWILTASHPLGASFTDAFSPSLGVDQLSGLFLGTLGLIAAPAIAFSMRYFEPDRNGRLISALMAAFVLAMALVLVARDPLTFLFAWESMTLIPAAIILAYRRFDRESRRSVFTYLAMTHVGGVGTWMSILLLAREGAMGAGATIRTGSTLQIVIAVAALIGMGTKAGVMPLHVWLPRAHPIAPAPVSALMSGVMIKVSVYALIRVLVYWLGVLPLWFGIVVVGVGAVSAVGGVVYALFQHELKRLLAFHSIENIGIIVLGLGACLILHSRGQELASALALGACLLHTVNHAVFKGLLFLAAGAFEKATGHLELDGLGGLLGRMPWTGAAFGIGAMSIAGLPGLNGFASEWLTLQALLRIPISAGGWSGVAGALALGALAAALALTLMCFVKVVGLVLLGPRRWAGRATEAPVPSVTGMLFLAAACVGLGMAPGLLFTAAASLAPWASGIPQGMGLTVPGTGSMSGVGIVVGLLILTGLLVALRGRRPRRASATWACGQQVGPSLRWSGAGFTMSLRLVLQSILRPHREFRSRPEDGIGLVHEVTFSGHVPHLIEEKIYAPIADRALVWAAMARRSQSGSLAAYVTYLIALVIVLLVAARVGVFG